MADETTNKLITLPLLKIFKTKIEELINAGDSAVRTDMLAEIGKLTSFEVKIVDTLPETGESGFIYFVKKVASDTGSASDNVYNEYIWVKSSVDSETYVFEKIGDTAVDATALKNELSAAHVADVDLTTSEVKGDDGITRTTYTFSFKNSSGTELVSKQFTIGGGYSVATTTIDGLMSAADKAKLDSLSAASEGYDGKYAKTVEVTKGDAVTTGNTSVSTVTITAKAADGTTALSTGTFDVTTYGEATAEAAGLMSAADKAKIDSYTLVTEEEINALFTKTTTETTSGS